MIYSHKPQRSGRSIPTNSNNPPQDPPPPSSEIPDILIEDTTPPVPDCTNEFALPEPKETPKKQVIKPSKKVTPQKTVTIKISWWKKLVSKILFWRKK